jgi:hypothetical protein
MLIRSSLVDHDAQLQNFTPQRDRYIATGQDANAKYREIQSQRDQLLAEWKKLSPTPSPVPYPDLPGSSALSLPIAALKILGPGLGPWFGYSGSVKMAPAQELADEIPSIPGVSGSIEPIPNGLLANAGVLFTAELATSENPASGIWLHSWQYLIAFPPPIVNSVFTYSLGMGVRVVCFDAAGSATFLSFISLGEAANFTGQEIMVNNDGFPLVTNLLASTSTSGGLNVQRSFLVGPGESPAVALVVGVTTVLSKQSSVLLPNDAFGSFICLAASVDPATGLGPVAERGIVNFHYQPLPPRTT